jgi:DNA polymerase III sliding clamp (beta) subunit (PCNA family)
VPGVELWTRAVVGEFPDYLQVIPTNTSLTRTLVADRATLVAAVEQCLPLTTERARGVTITGGATGLVFSVTNPDLGSVTVPVPVQGAEGLTFGVNAHYLLAALQTQDKTVTIRCSENSAKEGCVTSPLVLNGGPTKAVLMPMRIF